MDPWVIVEDARVAEAIAFIPQEHLKVVVLRSRGRSIDLKVSIDFTPERKAPGRAKGRSLAVAS
jgi:hypothetical protein